MWWFIAALIAGGFLWGALVEMANGMSDSSTKTKTFPAGTMIVVGVLLLFFKLMVMAASAQGADHPEPIFAEAMACDTEDQLLEYLDLRYEQKLSQEEALARVNKDGAFACGQATFGFYVGPTGRSAGGWQALKVLVVAVEIEGQMRELKPMVQWVGHHAGDPA